MLDLKICGGSIADGAGRPRFTGDIGIKDGVITEVGSVSTPARRRIDADGALVTPGFIDMHTHYDAQATWDAELLPSSLNGVTTAVIGNCGVGCAPRRPGDEDFIIDLLSGVEDIPVPVLEAAMDWRWRTFDEYLDVLAETPRTIDLGAYVSHGIARLYALGRRALDGGPMSSEDVASVKAVVEEALRAGAVGVSTGRIFSHRTASGRLTPDYGAPDAELLALADALRAFPGRVLQFASDFHQHLGGAAAEADLGLLAEIRGHDPGNISLALHEWPALDGGWRAIDAALCQIEATGSPLLREISSRSIGMLIGLGLSFHPFAHHPSFQALKALSAQECARRMRDPALRKRLLAEEPAGSPDDPDFRRIVGMINNADRIYVCDGVPDYRPPASASVRATAQRTGQTEMEIMLDALINETTDGLLYYPFFNFDAGALNGVRDRLSLPNAIISFGDAGAHSAMICDFAYSTFCLSFWARDRASGPGLPLEKIVSMMSGRQAEYFGFRDRGRIAVGLRADINVIDFDRLACTPPKLVHDLPGGGKRLLQLAEGYVATLVAGEQTVGDDALLGPRPGKVLRFGS